MAKRGISSLYHPSLDVFLANNISKRTPGMKFTMLERKLIQKHLSDKYILSLRAIAQKLSCNIMSLFKEIERNSENGMYDAEKAQEIADARSKNTATRRGTTQREQNRRGMTAAVYHPSLDEFITHNRPTRKREKRQRFDLWERKCTQMYLSQGLSYADMAKQMNCCSSSIADEIHRNSKDGMYDADRAHEKMELRKANAYQRARETRTIGGIVEY